MTEINFVQCLNIVCSSSSVLIENGGIIRPLQLHLHHHRPQNHPYHNHFGSVCSYWTAERLSWSVNCRVFIISFKMFLYDTCKTEHNKKLPFSACVKVSQWSIVGHCSSMFSTGVWVLVKIKGPKFQTPTGISTPQYYLATLLLCVSV